MTVLMVLTGLAAIGSFVLYIIVLIKLFQNEGVGKGILGLLCSLYTFVWGWIKHKELGLTKLMWIWTILFVVVTALSMVLQTQMTQFVSQM